MEIDEFMEGLEAKVENRDTFEVKAKQKGEAVKISTSRPVVDIDET